MKPRPFISALGSRQALRDEFNEDAAWNPYSRAGRWISDSSSRSEIDQSGSTISSNPASTDERERFEHDRQAVAASSEIQRHDRIRAGLRTGTSSPPAGRPSRRSRYLERAALVTPAMETKPDIGSLMRSAGFSAGRAFRARRDWRRASNQAPEAYVSHRSNPAARRRAKARSQTVFHKIELLVGDDEFETYLRIERSKIGGQRQKRGIEERIGLMMRNTPKAFRDVGRRRIRFIDRHAKPAPRIRKPPADLGHRKACASCD